MSLLRRILDADDPRCSHDSRYCSPPPPRLLPPFPTLYAPAPPPSAVNTPADVLSLPPPPPPSTRIQISNKNHFLILVAVVVAGTVLAVCLLSLAYYAARRYRSSRRRRRTAAVLGPPPPPSDDLLQEDLLAGAAGGGVEEPYHVWYIRTVGLDQAVIGAITVCEYKKGAGIVEGTDCAVCLGEFAEGEALRLLPKCSHAFHVPCIDTWLRSHVNCPLCRAPVLAPAPARPPPPLPSPNSAPSEMAAAAVQSSENSGGSEEDGDAAGSPLAQAVVDGAAAGSVGSSSSVEGLEIWVPIDLGDEVPSCVAGEERHVDGERQPVRRSMSMDSSALAGVLLRTRMAGSSRDGWRKPSVGGDGSANRKRRIGEDGYSRKGILLIDDPSGVERSMSGGRFFLSRLSGRTRGSNTILPL